MQQKNISFWISILGIQIRIKNGYCPEGTGRNRINRWDIRRWIRNVRARAAGSMGRQNKW